MIPEPGTGLLVMAGLAALAWRVRHSVYGTSTTRCASSCSSALAVLQPKASERGTCRGFASSIWTTPFARAQKAPSQ
ncbi:MAG: PEP-CTERM sorting domain-containing protein [Planctomycetota bacterium]